MWYYLNTHTHLRRLQQACCQYSLTATHCNTLQHTATLYCNTLQHTHNPATPATGMLPVHSHCSTLPHTATHCNTLLQHTATHTHTCNACNRHAANTLWARRLWNGTVLQCVAACCRVLQCVAVYCSALQCVAVCCSVLQRAAVSKLCGHIGSGMALVFFYETGRWDSVLRCVVV